MSWILEIKDSSTLLTGSRHDEEQQTARAQGGTAELRRLVASSPRLRSFLSTFRCTTRWIYPSTELLHVQSLRLPPITRKRPRPSTAAKHQPFPLLVSSRRGIALSSAVLHVIQVSSTVRALDFGGAHGACQAVEGRRSVTLRRREGRAAATKGCSGVADYTH